MLSNAIAATQQALTLALLVSLPVLAAAFVASLVTGWFAGTTQVNDPSLSHAPRLLAIALVLALLGAWGGRTVLHFTTSLWQSIPTAVR